LPKVTVSRPVKLTVQTARRMFDLDLPAPTKSCTTCRGSGSVYFDEDERLHNCQICKGSGGKNLSPQPQSPPRCHREVPRPHNMSGGRTKVTNNLTINIPVCMHDAMPFGPEDFITFTPTDFGLEISKADRSLYQIRDDWKFCLEPELLNLLSLEREERLHLRIVGKVLLIEKMPQQPESPAAYPEPRPDPVSTPTSVLNDPGNLVISPIIGTD
jgi:hypothetical protein